MLEEGALVVGKGGKGLGPLLGCSLLFRGQYGDTYRRVWLPPPTPQTLMSMVGSGATSVRSEACPGQHRDVTG